MRRKQKIIEAAGSLSRSMILVGWQQCQIKTKGSESYDDDEQDSRFVQAHLRRSGLHPGEKQSLETQQAKDLVRAEVDTSLMLDL